MRKTLLALLFAIVSIACAAGSSPDTVVVSVVSDLDCTLVIDDSTSSGLTADVPSYFTLSRAAHELRARVDANHFVWSHEIDLASVSDTVVVRAEVAESHLAWEQKKNEFFTAVGMDDVATVESMLESGFPIDAKDRALVTPIQSAAESGYAEIVKALLDSGTNVNLPGKYAMTPLHSAAGSGQVETVSLLIDRGADLQAVNQFGATPLHVAVESDHADIVQQLIEAGAPVDAEGADGTPLHTAAHVGDPEVMKLLLDSGASVDSRMSAADTPLHVAAHFGYEDCVALLLEHGAEVDALNQAEKTPLHLAAYKGRLESSRLLVEAGADVTLEDTADLTPIVTAIFRNHEDVAALLLKHVPESFDVNQQDSDGSTLLHYAAQANQAEVVGLLLSMGADKTLQDSGGKTAFDHAKMHGYHAVVQVLMD